MPEPRQGSSTFQSGDTRRVARLAAAKERRHAVLAAAKHPVKPKVTKRTRRRSIHPNSLTTWTPPYDTVAFEVLVYACTETPSLTAVQIARHMGRTPETIRPLVSQLRTAGLVVRWTGKRQGTPVVATDRGANYYAAFERRERLEEERALRVPALKTPAPKAKR